MDEPRGFLLKDSPTPADRDALERRQLHLLREWMVPCAPNDLIWLMADFLEDYPANFHLDDEAAEKLTKKYVDQVKGAPKWAVEAVIRKFRAGHGDQRFTPTVAEFMWSLQAELRPIENELNEIKEVLDAPILSDPMPSAEARAEQVRTLWTEGLRLEIPSREVRTPEELEVYQEVLEMTAKQGDKMVQEWRKWAGVEGEGKHSPALLAKIEQIRQGNVGKEKSSAGDNQGDRSRSA